jgi:hypothetical protein
MNNHHPLSKSCGNFLVWRLLQIALCAVQLSSASITLKYTDPWDGIVKPLAGAVVKVFDAAGREKWTSPPTDASGSVSVSGVVPTKIDYSAQIYITVSAKNEAVRIIQHQSCFQEALNYVPFLLNYDASIYPVAIKTDGRSLDGRSINVGDGYLPTVLGAGKMARQMAVSKFAISPAVLDVHWDPCLYSGTGWAHFLGKGGDFIEEFQSFFAGTNMTLRPVYMKSEMGTRATVAHEYGHYIHFLMNQSQTLPGGGSHSMYSRGDKGLAFSEGWAEFFGEYTVKKNGFPWPSYHPEVELFPQTNNDIRGPDQEGHVAAFFWDLLDVDIPNANDETVSSDWLKVKAVFGDHSSGIQAYRNNWMYRYPSDYEFDELFKKTFFYGFPGYTPAIPATKMVHFTSQTVSGTTITKPFQIGATEVTQGEYYDLMGKLPSQFNALADFSLPVELVSWYDAVLYCNAKSEKAGLPKVYSYTSLEFTGPSCSWMTNLTIDLTKPGYRLPTKEEWIWAYKAGTTTPFYWGNLAPDNFAWFSGNGGSMTHPVGLKTPNANGLYDMAGNVMEWLNLENPSGSTMASAKGGGYNNTQPYLDHNAIWSAPTSFMNPWAGFRVARNYVNMQPIYLLLAD